ncbi:MAG: hypothetical protein EA350_00660 [Gemmatimonadales bacterium]|nr:MAG: hypothetical protein EA350_00660 [Gemmatimonadales bacterium]
MSLVIVLFGIIAFTFLGVREFPSVDAPVITVTTNYPGANASVIESQITEPLEESVNGIEGIRSLTSVTREGRSTIQVEFALDENLDRAANDVRDRVSRVLGSLPPDVDPPQISKASDDEDPIIFLNVYSDRRDLLELTRIAQDLFAERLQTIPGVSRVDIWGQRRYAMRLRIDPQRLAAYRLSMAEVRAALGRENVELPSGRLEGDEVQLTIRTLSRLETPEEFENIILREEAGQTIRLRDVGRAELAAQNERTILKRDGIPMVGVVLRPLPGANNVAVADEFHRRLAVIERDLPEDIRTNLGFDTSEFIRASISEVQRTVLLALFLVILIIFLFLRDWRTTLVPVVTIPVALVGAFFGMWALGFSINVLTLLALVLAVGIVVDDAIVVVENIYAKIEAGEDPREGSIDGTREIFFAIVSTTLALVAVFLPIVFLGGLTGQLFQEFGLTLAVAVVISSFVALTLAPMLCSRLLRKRERKPWFYRVTEPSFQRLTDGYRNTLDAFLARRWLAFVILPASLGVGLLLFQSLPQELAPTEDRGGMRLVVSGPEGATFAYMDQRMDALAELVREEVPEYRAIISVTSPGFGAASSVNSGFVRLSLVDADQRARSQAAIARALGERTGEIRGVTAFVAQDQSIRTGGGGGLPVQFVLQGPTLEALQEVLPEFLDAARARPELAVVDVNLTFDSPEIEVAIDRDRARNLGVTTEQVGEALQLALSEQRTGFFVMEGQQYDVILEVERDRRRDPAALRSLYVQGSNGRPVQLDNVVTLRETAAPPQLYRFDRFASATVSAGLADGYVIGDGVRAMREAADEVLDERFTSTLTGASRDFEEGAQGILFLFGFALVLVFLILAGQFESFRDPLTIMLTVPLALVGALGALALFGQTLNIFSQIGMVMLIGLVTKNGILIVEFANQRKAAGLSVLEAAREGAASRFRPVVMTSLSTSLGILPLALALGAGAGSRVPLGIAVIGGLVVGTILTLFVVPAMYTFLGRPADDGSAGNRSADPRGAGVAAATVLVLVLAAPPAGLEAQGPAGQPGAEELQALELGEALRMALGANPEILQARNQARQAAVGTGFGAAGLLPSVRITGDQRLTRADTDQTFAGQDPQELRGAESRQGNLRGTVALPLVGVTGGLATRNRLDAQARAEAFRARGRIEEILAEVTLAYFELVRLEQELVVLAEALETSEARLRIARVREEVGAAAEVEVRQAQVDRNADEAELLRREIETDAARVELNRLLGRRPEAALRPVDSTEIPATGRPGATDADPALDLAVLREAAMSGNPGVQAARAALEGAESLRNEARAARLPFLELETGAELARQRSESGFVQESQATNLFVGISGSFTVFDGFRIQQAGEEARLVATGARLVVEDAEARVEAQLLAEWSRYTRRLALLELETENVEIARSNVGTALEQFELGVISSLELRETQDALTRADTRRLDSAYQVRVAETELLRLAGLLEGRATGGVELTRNSLR